jgi:hypothetical protein
MNTQPAIPLVVDADAPVERLDAILQPLEVSSRLGPGERDLEGQHAIRVNHADRCLGPA